MRERINQRGFRGKCRIEEVAIGETVRLRDCRDGVRVGGEVHARRFVGHGLNLLTPVAGLRQLKDALPCQVVGARLLVLPAVDGGEGDADEFRELGLRQAFGLAEVFNFMAIMGWYNG